MDKSKLTTPTKPHLNSQRREGLDIPKWLERGQQNWSNIRYLRRLVRLSQPEMAWMMAKYTGHVIDFTTISTHEQSRRNPTIEQLTAYARIFKVPVFYLFCEIVPLEELKALLPFEGDWEDPIESAE